MNRRAMAAIFRQEIARALRRPVQSLLTPVLPPFLFLLVLGRIGGLDFGQPGGMAYVQFILPGLIVLPVVVEAVSHASFSVFLPRFSGTVYELRSAPVNFAEVALAHIVAAAVKAICIGALALAAASQIVDFEVRHPAWLAAGIAILAVYFAFVGVVAGVQLRRIEDLKLLPSLALTPMIMLGGIFYPVEALPGFWEDLARANPATHLIELARWSFHGAPGTAPAGTASVTALVLVLTLLPGTWLLRRGYECD